MIWTPARQATARATAEKWAGTPHRDRMAKVGVGIDCLYLMREIAVDAGILPAWDFPYYHPGWGVGRQFNIIERIFTKCCHVERATTEEINEGRLQFGDILVFRVGRQSNHVGMAMDGRCFHSQARHLVTFTPLAEPVIDRLQSVLRFTDAGFKMRPENLTHQDFQP